MSYINDSVMQSATGQSSAQQVTSGQVTNPTRSLAAAAAPAIISVVGDVVSTLFGNSSQKEENQRNRDFELEMWKRNNEYNSPKNQKARLEEAGYNPYLLDSDSSSSGQSVMPPAPSASPLMSFGHPFSASAELFQKGLQVQANQEQQHADAMQKIYDILFDAYDKGGQKLYDQAKDELAPLMQRFEWNNSFQDIRLRNYIRGQELQNAQLDLENQFKAIENKWVDILSKDKHLLNVDTHTLNMDTHKNLQETLNKIRAEINKINVDAALGRAQRDKVVAEKVGVIVDNGLKALDFQIRQDVKDDIIDQYRNNADKSGYDALNSYKTAKYGSLEKMMPFGHQIELNEDYQDRGAYDRHMRREGRIKRNKKRLYSPE